MSQTNKDVFRAVMIGLGIIFAIAFVLTQLPPTAPASTISVIASGKIEVIRSNDSIETLAAQYKFALPKVLDRVKILIGSTTERGPIFLSTGEVGFIISVELNVDDINKTISVKITQGDNMYFVPLFTVKKIDGAFLIVDVYKIPEALGGGK